MEIVNLKNPDPIFGQEAICYFNLQQINGRWHADVIFTESRIGDQGLKTVPWDEIDFQNDPQGDRKNAYLQDHIRVESKKKTVRLLVKESLWVNLLWGMN